MFEKYYFFIHIPKTAGSSFRNMLYKQFPQDVVYPNLNDIKANEGRYPQRKVVIETLKGTRDVQFLMGHYPFMMGENMPQPPECIVFLRDPVERAISNLYHLQRHSPQFKNTSTRVMIESANWQINNVQARYMGDRHFRPNKLFTAETELGAKALIRAKKNLDACAFVGFTEHFDASLAALQEKFNWNLGRVLKKNTSPKQRQVIPKDLRKKLIELNRLDIELYQYAREKFKSRTTN